MSTGPKQKTVTGTDSSGILWKKFVRPELSTVILLAIATIISVNLSPYFADITFILQSTSMFIEFGIISITMTLIIIAGQIDLSIASIMALVAVVTATLYQKGFAMTGAIVVGILLGLVLGFFNALLIAKLKLPALIVTIGTMALYRGIAQIMLGDRSIGKFPSWFVGVDTRTVATNLVPLTLVMFIVTAIIFGALLHFTVFGRRIYALGTNQTAALYSAVPVDLVKFMLFGFSGLVSAAAGILMMSRLGVARFDMATGGELDVITIVLLGGTDINGGKGNMFGTFIAFFLVVIIRTGMTVANITAQDQLTIMGGLLIFSIIITNLINKLQTFRRTNPTRF